MTEAEEKVAAERAQPRRRYWFHWQNLNDRKNGSQGSGFWHGRCWWHFDPRGTGKTIGLCWNFWSSFCGIGFDIHDEDLTFNIAFPPVALWLSFSTNWALIDFFAPRKVLSLNYPDTIVIDERECEIRIHSGRAWIHPWTKCNESVRADPWWVRGVSFSINPFEAQHMRHEVRRADGSWVPFVGSWEEGRDGKQSDGKELLTFPYVYVLKNGTRQERTATVFVDRRAWRPRIFRWTSLFERVRTSIDITFNNEVGERTGSWKGGCIGCGWELLPSETPEQALRRMEAIRKF